MDQVAVQERIERLRSLVRTERLIGLYEFGIEGCTAKDTGHVVAVLQELVRLIDYQYLDIADGFKRLYEYCLEEARQGGFHRVKFNLSDLRDTLQRNLAGSAPA